jgi:ABC-type amino acid transport system permease subunit
VTIGAVRGSAVTWLSRAASAYIELMRNVPLVVKLFFLYFVVGLDALPAAIVGLITHQSGFIADVTAAGLRSIPREQAEAGFATGLSPLQVYGSILLPQAIRITIPPMTNQFIELVKNSAAVSLIGLQDLTFSAQDMQVYTYRYLEAFIVVTVLYVAICFAISGAMAVLRSRLAPA